MDLELAPRGTVTLFRKPIVIADDGMHLGDKHITWDDVDYYTYRWQAGHIAGDLFVVARDRRYLRIDHRYYDWRAGADRILAELHPRLAVDPYFQPFSFGEGELVHAGAGRIGLDLVDRVEVVRLGSEFAIAVIRRGDTHDWSHDQLVEVHDSLLFLDELVKRGVAVTGSELWLPPCLHHLADALGVAAELPRAEIVRRP
ncbi:MAG TPA: hypothetical protein VGO00_00025 [Kofleriaceae bacterium]|nr:hypothetical protein [Kofleriaceae bacterium]